MKGRMDWVVRTGKCAFCKTKTILIHKICKKCVDSISGLFRRKEMKQRLMDEKNGR